MSRPQRQSGVQQSGGAHWRKGAPCRGGDKARDAEGTGASARVREEGGTHGIAGVLSRVGDIVARVRRAEE